MIEPIIQEDGNFFNEENFRKIVEYAPVGILMIDGDLHWRMVNQRFCDITGYPKAELLGKTFIDITHEEDVKLNMDLYLKMLSGAIDNYEYEKRYIRKDGRIIWVHLNVSAIRMNGNYSHMVVTVQDIDENKQYRQALELKNKELDTLFYKASHDLRSPVSSLKGLCHLLKGDHPNLVDDESFAHLEQTVNFLQLQNNRLLLLTQINDHTVELNSNLVTKLVSNIEKHLGLAGTIVRHRNLNYSIQTDNFLLTVILTNILENILAHKSPTRALKIEIKLQVEPGRSLIQITDNGRGIEPIAIAHAFDMFYKDSSDATATGLELYIAKKAVDKLKGDIELESEVGKGSIFSIFLPSV
ncbi:MAG: PAS domain-containing sensor histidine kinase [Bacteroidia bacterium]|nr:PAS domain-containing sensor histidine kinase [Bacteroidia bacterium]